MLSIERNRVQAGAGNVVENESKDLFVASHLALRRWPCRGASARYTQERLALGAAHRDSGYVAVNEIGEAYTPTL